MVNLIKVPKGKTIPFDYKKGEISEQFDLSKKPIEKSAKEKKVSSPTLPFIPYEKVPEYLVPKGDGWYGDPEEPPDPQDCDGAFGDTSPWCGGNPVDAGAILKLSPFTYEPKIRFDECNVWAQLGGTLFGLQMPPKTIALRLPGECRNEPPLPPPLPEGKSGKRLSYPGGFDSNAIVYAFVGGSFGGSGIYFADDAQGRRVRCNYSTGYSIDWTKYNCPGMKQHHKIYTTSTSFIWYDSPINGVLNESSFNIDPCQFEGDGAVNNNDLVTHWDTNSARYSKFGISTEGRKIWEENPTFSGRRYLVPQPYPMTIGQVEIITTQGDYGIYFGSYGLICLVLEYIPPPEVDQGGVAQLDLDIEFVVSFNCTSAKNRDKLPPPPRPDDEDDDCCMSCQQQNELLRQLLAEIKKANKAIGSDSFPVQAKIFDQDETKQEAQSTVIKLNNIAQSITRIVEEEGKLSKIIGIDVFPLELPESIIVNPEKNIIQKALDFLNPFKNVKINSVMELLVWNIKQQSAVFGQWGQVIQVESTEIKEKNVDGKITKEEHTKTEEVVLPNMAQTMKEQILLQTQLMKNTGLTMDMTVKLMIELAQSKLIIAETVKRVEDIQQYLDYPTNERTVEVPLQINFPNVNDPQDKQNDLFELLKEGKSKIVFDDWTGEHSQDEKFLDLLQAAKTIMGVYYSKTD